MMEGGGPSIMESLEHIGVNGRDEEGHFQPTGTTGGMVGGLQCSKTRFPSFTHKNPWNNSCAI